MKLSQRAKRMDRRHKRQTIPGINLVSLMDIFTILVFFLLVNSSNTQQLPNQKSIKLPESIAEQMPKETLTIMVNDKNILVNGRAVEEVPDILALSGDNIPALQRELRYQASKSPAVAVNELGVAEREVTIMGDRAIPYALLRRIMMTCSNSEYSRISLAVLKKESTEDVSI
ncbi:biopolymer transporter ExbD [Ketobacter sp. MCCC 1A13808]|uniref:ExbD/TolR family protein n=1 Tax=Ketobacter sp. MCCC 1A13808 TaxID=2602738 RepID=UPI000F230E6F|nr:biopolymer transporter ExbD [Ketobacter sp. MCCC 1A13808]MVF12646.1 biopolymer transporter ExbD [Ketobacter sp. MCCC 1A13808]RLP55558.1 MAG: biopolymer transporter ExbD [Ketobacter sp.]